MGYIPKAPLAPLDGYPLYDPSTAIQNIELSTSDAIYTVGGIRVNSAKMSKGLYIQNGKKYVVK